MFPFLIFLSLFGGILAAVAVFAAGSRNTGRSPEEKEAARKISILYLILSFGMLGSVIFGVSPFVLGYGRVPNKAEEYTERLEIGVAYEPLASYEDGESEILLVKKDGDSKVLAIRVKGPIPLERFTLVDGKPAALR